MNKYHAKPGDDILTWATKRAIRESHEGMNKGAKSRAINMKKTSAVLSDAPHGGKERAKSKDSQNGPYQPHMSASERREHARANNSISVNKYGY